MSDQATAGAGQTQLGDAQTTIDERDNEIFLLKAEFIDLREKEENLKYNLKNESTKSSNLLQTNELLQLYIESLTGINENFESDRKRSNISDTTRQCQLRKLKEIKSRTQCAMRFLDNFGLKSESLVVLDTSGASHDVSYQNNTESDKDTLKKSCIYSTGFTYLTNSIMNSLQFVRVSQNPT